MQTKDQMQTTLQHARRVRAQFDEHLKDAQQRVEIHLANMASVCLQEMRHLKNDDPLADGNIDNAREQLDEAIKQFRNVQSTIRAQDDEIEDLVQMLADDEVWK